MYVHSHIFGNTCTYGLLSHDYDYRKTMEAGNIGVKYIYVHTYACTYVHIHMYVCVYYRSLFSVYYSNYTVCKSYT